MLPLMQVGCSRQPWLAPLPPQPHCSATQYRLRYMKHAKEPAAAADANEASSMLLPPLSRPLCG